MATIQAHRRLNKEYKAMEENHIPYIIARPSEENILEWHYVITGPADTPYEGGQYHGTLLFPGDYPFKPPSIRMTTPNGRFKENTRLCLSMSDYHPDTWNPSWSVSTILTGLLSFMTGDENTTGSIITSSDYKKKIAKQSKFFNATYNVKFINMFPELVKQNLIDLENESKKAKNIADNKSGKNETIANEMLVGEKVIELNDIKDPEDRIRAQQLNSKESNIHESLSSFSWLYLILALLAFAIGLSIK